MAAAMQVLRSYEEEFGWMYKFDPWLHQKLLIIESTRQTIETKARKKETDKRNRESKRKGRRGRK